MSKKIYSIYDVKAGFYAPPFVANTDGEASRQIAMALMASPTIPPAMYPEDFALCQVGDWDEVTGVVAPNYLRICSCDWILRTLTKNPAASTAEEPKKEDVENA